VTLFTIINPLAARRKLRPPLTVTQCQVRLAHRTRPWRWLPDLWPFRQNMLMPPPPVA
jgi:hypothetical protein